MAQDQEQNKVNLTFHLMETVYIVAGTFHCYSFLGPSEHFQSPHILIVTH